LTQCPALQTLCPPTQTKCPPRLTTCVDIPTLCPTATGTTCAPPTNPGATAQGSSGSARGPSLEQFAMAHW
jgi:hypothetical protein